MNNGNNTKNVNTAENEFTVPSSASKEELELLRKVRLALGSMLHMLECSRDDLVAMGERMDRLRVASERCRTTLAEQKKNRERDTSSDVPDSE